MHTTHVTTAADTTSAALAGLVAAQARIDAAEVDKLQAALAWAQQHTEDSLVGPASTWEQPISLGGPGAPLVGEFCVAELAAVLGVSTDAGHAYLADAIELRYRLPRTFARVVCGDLRVWKARRIAQGTLHLPGDGARFVDAHVAPVAHRIGYAALERLIGEALVRFDPEAAHAARLAAAESRCFDVHTAQVSFEGTVDVSGTLDLADALDLDTAVTTGAAALAALGCPDSLDVRRSLAAGQLARRQLSLDLAPAVEGRATGATKARQVILHVHLADAALARVEEPTSAGTLLSVQQVRSWCADSDTAVTITPVIDLNATPSTTAYEIPDRIREQVILRDTTCAFPWCGRNARRCDLDHVVPHGQGGSTTPPNLAPLCRRHHRLKTHAGWTYETTDDPPGTSHWTSPHGYRFRRDPTGTTEA